jgi:predicted small secreted protein
MKKAVTLLIAFILLLAAPALLAGCGSESGEGADEEVALYTLENIIIPQERDSDFVAAWLRKSTGGGDVSIDALGLRFWKWEGGALSEITLEEYKELAAVRADGDDMDWVYSQHSITVMEIYEEEREAVVETGSLYGPLTGIGVRYLLRREDGEWVKVSEETVWVS